MTTVSLTPYAIGVTDENMMTMLRNTALVRLLVPSTHAELACDLMNGLGLIDYNIADQVKTSTSSTILTYLNIEFYKLCSPDEYEHLFGEVIKRLTFGAIADLLYIGDSAITAPYGVNVSTSRRMIHSFNAKEYYNHSWYFSNPITEHAVLVLNTSPECPLVTLIGEEDIIASRSGATYYLYIRNDGFFNGWHRGQEPQLDNDPIYGGEINLDLRNYSKDKQYRIALIIRAYRNCYNAITPSTFDGIVGNFHTFAHIAPMIDTRLDWDGKGDLPIPASIEEIKAEFEKILKPAFEESIII